MYEGVERLMNVEKKGMAMGIFLIILVCIMAFQLISYGEINKGSMKERIEKAVVIYVNSNFALVSNEERKIDADDGITPVIKDGRVLVPVRFVTESFDADVSWDQDSSTASIQIQDKSIEIAAGSTEMIVDHKKYHLDVHALLRNKRLFVPLRAVSEALDKEVFYDRGLIIISDIENIFDPDTEKSILDRIIAKVNKLPAVGTKEKLTEILEGIQQTIPVMRKAMNVASMDFAQDASGSAEESTEYSKTNVQVQRVDEADKVKTDGSYIYQISGQKTIVSKAYPAEDMEVVKAIEFEEDSFIPHELYVDERHLVVIGSYYEDSIDTYENKKTLYPTYPTHKVRAYIYDITDKTDITEEREIELDGEYVSSRKIGSYLYIISNYGINYHIMEEEAPLRPFYKDSAVSQVRIPVDYDDIKYIPPVEKPAYLVVGALDLCSSDGMKVETYLGTGDEIYVSENNLYITVDSYAPNIYRLPENGSIPDFPEYKTLIYKFSLDNTSITYLSKGEVPGKVLNQFSMDEYNGKFRIATTERNYQSRRETSNHVYVLDESLNITGRLEDIAPGEEIYSVRFMGEKAYLVTFEKVDPLFVLDLKDPSEPKILGALKIPGYSDYLHPFDENHLVGFGKDTMELSVKDKNGNVVGTNVYEMGIKIALFDVRDVSHPIEKFKVIIGGRGTDSELLRNHKALLFDREKELFAFPVTVREIQSNEPDHRIGIPQSGETAFQGGYVYRLTKDNGFELKGRMSHMTSEDYLKSGYYHLDNSREIKRLLYIGEVLYAVSDNIISAHEIDTIDEINRVASNKE